MSGSTCSGSRVTGSEADDAAGVEVGAEAADESAARLPSVLLPTTRDLPAAPGTALGRGRGSAVPAGLLFALGVVALLVSLAVAMVIGSGDIGFGELARVVGGHIGLAVEPLPRLLDYP